MSADPAATLYLLGATVLFAVGLFGVIAAEHAVRRVLAVNVMGTAVFIVLIATAARSPGAAPDPVPHAMVLTGIVVAVCGSGLALTLIKRIDDHDRERDAKKDRSG